MLEIGAPGRRGGRRRRGFSATLQQPERADGALRVDRVLELGD